MSIKLNKNHPFVIAAFNLEQLEFNEGYISEGVIEARKELKNKYPEFYNEYIRAKNGKQQQRIYSENIERSEGKPIDYWRAKDFRERKKLIAENKEK